MNNHILQWSQTNVSHAQRLFLIENFNFLKEVIHTEDVIARF